MKKHIYFLLILHILSLPVWGQSQEFRQTLAGEQILCMEQDSQGYIWIGTLQGLYRYNGSMFQAFTARNDSLSLNSDYVNHLLTDRQGTLWLTNECGIAAWNGYGFKKPEQSTYTPIIGIYDLNDSTLFSIKMQSLELLSKKDLKTRYSTSLPSQSFIQVHEFSNRQKEFWFYQDNTLFVLDQSLKQQKSLPSSFYIQKMTVDEEGNRIWVYNERMLSSYNLKTHEEMPLEPEMKKWLNNHPHILFVEKYDKNELLIGLENDKLYLYNVTSGSISPIDFRVHLSPEEFSCCLVDKGKNIWIADKTGNLQFFPHFTASSTIYLESFANQKLPIINLQTDPQGFIWLLSYNEILSYDKTSGQILSRRKIDHMLNHYMNAKLGYFIVPYSQNIEVLKLEAGRITEEKRLDVPYTPEALCMDKEGTIWAASKNKIGNIRKNSVYKSIKIPNDSVSIKKLVPSASSSKLYIVTTDNYLYVWDEAQKAFNHVYIPIHNLDNFFDDDSGNLWLGSFNEGLVCYNPETKEIRQWNTSNGLPNNHAKEITMDHDGKIWIASSNYIARLTPSTNQFLYVKDINLGSTPEYINTWITDEGTLYCLGRKGITYIDPNTDDFRELEKNAEEIPLYLDKIEGEGNNYTASFLQKGKLDLKHNENTLHFYFSGIRFEQGSHLNYSYKMEGLDENWIESGTNQYAVYSSLPAGDYIFKARVKNLNGEWSRSELEIPIHINPAPWLSWWAFCLYFLLLAGIVGILIWLYIRHKISSERLNLVEREKEMAQEQIDFLANLSHELHTPLTLINAPLAQLQHSGHINESDRVLVNLAMKNTENLRKLSDQILETGKKDHRLENRLEVTWDYLPNIVKTLADNFRFIAAERGIKVEIKTDTNVGSGYFDREKVEKILSNLMSNAIKYTASENGELMIHTYLKGNSIWVSVKDNGAGIAPEKQKELFKRYNRLSMETEKPEISGHGVGLSYSQYLAHIHHGEIIFEPRESGGSNFILSIPYDKSSYAESEIVTSQVVSSNKVSTEPQEKSEKPLKSHTVLIVEDNSDIRDYLKILFEKDYNVTTTADGMEALEHLEAGALPDIVISDIIMPRKDGYQLCREIRENQNLSRIPIILLTAKDSTESHLKSLNLGADAYIPKPFDPYILLSQVENLIRNRSYIQSFLASKTSSTIEDIKTQECSELKEDTTPAMSISEEDKKFLDKIYHLLDKHLNDNNYTVALLAQDIGISFNTLSARMKMLLGETPHSFITTYRMNKALEMLRSGKTVSEVCYSVGASAIQNFSRTFKAKFGVPPTQFEQIS